MDGSFFRSGAAVNPTLTIIANVLRVADHYNRSSGITSKKLHYCELEELPCYTNTTIAQSRKVCLINTEKEVILPVSIVLQDKSRHTWGECLKHRTGELSLLGQGFCFAVCFLEFPNDVPQVCFRIWLGIWKGQHQKNDESSKNDFHRKC
jgi:hypothetical protein